MTEMTRAAAKKEAMRRWGGSAHVEGRPYDHEFKKGPDGKFLRPLQGVRVDRPYRAVGLKILGGLGFSVEGSGQTWEQAFYRADHKYDHLKKKE